MNTLVVLKEGEARATTLAIANGTDNDHASVYRLVKTYQHDLEDFGIIGFEIEKSGTVGRPSEYAFLNERQAMLLMTYMKNTEVVRTFKKSLVREFYQMAQMIKHPQLPASFADALEAMAVQVRHREALAKELETKEQQLAVAAPKVELYDKAMFIGETTSINETAKILEYPPNKFRRFLRGFSWIYKIAGRDVPLQDKINEGLMTMKITEWGTSSRFTPKGIEAVAAKIAALKNNYPEKYEIVFG